MKRKSAKNRAVYQLGCLSAMAVAYAATNAASGAANTVDIFTGGSSATGTALDAAANWSQGVVPTNTYDAEFGTAYPNSSSSTYVSIASAVNFGSIDNLNTSWQVNITGNPTSNTSSNSITLGGGGGTNSVGGPSDLLYAATGTNMDFRLGGTAYNYGSTSIVLAQSGNFNVSGTGSVYINDAITNASTGSYGITKTGLGILALASTGSTFTGGVTLASGILEIGGGGSLGKSPSTAAIQLSITGNSDLDLISNTGVGATRIFNISSGVTAELEADYSVNSSGGTVLVMAPLLNPVNGSGGSILKVGIGTILLEAANGYTGTTNIATGTLALSNSSAGVWGTISSSSPLILAGGTLSLTNGYNTIQAFPSTTLAYGSASYVSVAGFNKSTESLALAGINRSVGSTVDFVLPSVGSVTTTTQNTSYGGNAATIIGGYATASNQTTWAVSSATGTSAGSISGLTNYDQVGITPGVDVDFTPTTTLTATSINSLRFNSSASSLTFTIPTSLTIASGGILVTANAYSAYQVITGGTLTSGNGQDLVVTVANNSSGTFQLLSNIVDNTAATSGPTSIGLTKSGSGILFLGGSNTFTGPTNVDAGQLQLDNQYALVNSTLTTGTVVFYQGIGSFTIGGIGTNSNIALQDNGGSAVALTFGGDNANTIFNGIFTGSGSLTKIGTGITYLADAASTFTGGLTIDAGTIQFIAGASFGASTNVPVINNGAAVLYNGSGAAVWGAGRSFELGGGADTIEIGSLNTPTNTSTSSLAIGQVGNTSSGSLMGPGTLIKTGLGTLYLNIDDTYSGGTTLEEGYLTVFSANSLGTSNYGGTSGPLAIIPSQLFATLTIQTPAVAVSSLTNYVNGNASAGTAGIILGSYAVGGASSLTIGADGTSTTFSGNISDVSANYSGAVGSIIKVGTGILTLSGTNTYTGGTNVTSGSLVIAGSKAMPTLSNLIIGSGATVQAAGSSAGIYALSLNTLSNGGLLDLTTNAAVIHSGSTIAGVFSQVASGYSGGAWNGTTGITSSSAAADTKHLTAVGVIINDTTANSTGTLSGQAIYPSIDGASTSDGDIIVKTTYYGDANLSGVVDGSDYSLIDNGYLNALTGWYNGDFNYDGVVNGSDYTLIDNAFNTQGATLASQIATPASQLAGASATSAVPEPASLGIVGMSALGLLGKRRRRK